MEALPHPDAPLPDDVPTLHALVRRLLAEVADLRGKLDAALRHRFGRRSERRPRPAAPEGDGAEKKKRDEHGRAALPDDLPRREVVHDLPEADRACPCCGAARECIGEQACEQLDLEPAKFFVLRTVKRTYACRRCDPASVPPERRITTAGPAQVGPIPKGLCGPGLLAHCVTAKYADHVPLHRLAGQLARSGVDVARSTLGGWVARAAGLLTPLVALMHARLLLSRVIHGDDTGVKLRVEGAGKAAKAHLWVYIGDQDFPYTVFDFTAGYTADGPEGFLGGFKGHLQADALAQYEGLYRGGVGHCCCWAHARRKFVAASEGGDKRADGALALIRELYAVERGLPPLLPPSEEAGHGQRREREEQRRAARQAGARPVLERLGAWLEGQAGTLPKTPLGQAITYARNNWAALNRYLEQGYLSIDNNLSERTLRAVALGRNNWGVVGSEAGGRTAAVLYSVVGTCKHLGIDPFAYLRDALPGLFALGDEPTAEQLAEWLPDRWLLRRARESPSAAG
ncbi:MAG: IS66 family transposase [Limisphaerales bacterium]